MAEAKERRLALVTGASDGIGRELARELARRGYDLVLTSEDSGLIEVASALASTGASVLTIQEDLCNYEGVERLWREVQAIGRPLEVAVINAGVGVNGDFARQTDLAAELKLIDLNVTSSVHLAKRVLADMVQRNSGRILITSSLVAMIPATYTAVYGGSKAFLFNFAEAIRKELDDTNVVVTTLLPGATETNFFHRAGMEDTAVGSSKKDDPAVVARQGIDGLLAGKDHVVAGSWANKLTAGASGILPERLKATFHARQAKPGSGKEHHP